MFTILYQKYFFIIYLTYTYADVYLLNYSLLG